MKVTEEKHGKRKSQCTGTWLSLSAAQVTDAQEPYKMAPRTGLEPTHHHAPAIAQACAPYCAHMSSIWTHYFHNEPKLVTQNYVRGKTINPTFYSLTVTNLL